MEDFVFARSNGKMAFALVFVLIAVVFATAVPVTAARYGYGYEDVVSKSVPWNGGLPAWDMLADLQGKYRQLFDKTRDVPPERLMKIAEGKAREGDEESAAVLYAVVCRSVMGSSSEQDKTMFAMACLGMGDCYYARGNYPEALDQYVRGLEVYETCARKDKVGMFYNNMGIIYCTFLDYEKGVDLYKKGYECAKKHGDIATEYKLLANLLGVSIYLGDVKEARKYYAASERLRDRNDNEKTFMSRYSNGFILMAEKKYDKAAEVLRSAYGYGQSHGISPRYICAVGQLMYRTYMIKENADSVRHYLNLCMQIAKKHDIKHLFIEILNDYSKLYEYLGDTAKAQDYKSRYLLFKDSVLGRREFNIAKNRQFVYEMKKINDEIAGLYATDRLKQRTIKLQMIVVVIASVCALITLAFLVVIYLQKKKLGESYKSLYEINRNITEELERKKNAGDGQCEKYRSSKIDRGQKDRLAADITRVMEETLDFCRDDFSLETLARLVDSNSKYVSQVINESFGKNFTSFINEYRIRLACAKLNDTEKYGNLTISAIAEEVGFKSHAQFIRVFKKITGITPSLYQKMSNSEKNDGNNDAS